MDERLTECLGALVTQLRELEGVALHPLHFTGADPERDPTLARFLDALTESRILDGIAGKLQVLGRGAILVESHNAAAWLCRRALQVGAEQAVLDLTQHKSRDSFTANQAVLLTGLHVGEVHDLGRGVFLVPPARLPDSRIQDAPVAETWGWVRFPTFDSALISPFEHPVRHLDQNEADSAVLDERRRVVDAIDALLEDARLSICAVGTWGPQVAARMTIFDDSTPALTGRSWSSGSFRQGKLSPRFLAVHAASARTTFEAMASLPPGGGVRIALERLGFFHASPDLVQSAIELRTAMDALYLDDQDRHEMRHRLITRAAIVQGGSLPERLRTRKLFKDAYDVGSAAVHNGTLSERDTKKARSVLAPVADIVAHAAGLRIRHPKVEWAAIEVTGSFPG